jgi:hypothetical protein
MKRTAKKASHRREPKFKLPVSVVTREGKTTIRQFQGRRFVRFGEFRGKKVAWVEFYSWGGEYNSISIRFQDRRWSIQDQPDVYHQPALLPPPGRRAGNGQGMAGDPYGKVNGAENASQRGGMNIMYRL